MAMDGDGVGLEELAECESVGPSWQRVDRVRHTGSWDDVMGLGISYKEPGWN